MKTFKFALLRQEKMMVAEIRVVSVTVNDGWIHRFSHVTSSQEVYQLLLDGVIRAVDAWIRCSDEGRQCFEYAGEDLNIGDLVSYLDDADLNRCFSSEGITDFKVMEPIVSGWNHDTVLTTVSEEDVNPQ